MPRISPYSAEERIYEEGSVMNFEKCYDLADEIADLLVLLRAELIEHDGLHSEADHILSDMRELGEWIEEVHDDDYEETIRDVKRWLDARCGV